MLLASQENILHIWTEAIHNFEQGLNIYFLTGLKGSITKTFTNLI